MPITTCSECNHYVNVPNVQNVERFLCPYCIPKDGKKTPLLLYKCNACQKVSIFPERNQPQACPRCRTLVRTLMSSQTSVADAPFVEKEWLYHVTSTAVARLVKAGGLRSALARTGVREPDPDGSFAKDRINRVPKSIDSRLKHYIATCRSQRDDNWFIGQATAYTPMPLAFTGDNNDYVTLKALDDSRFKAFGQVTLGEVFVVERSGTAKLARDGTTTGYFNTLKAQPGHYLTKLATDYANLNFDIEGAITASHVYFLNTEKLSDITTGFKDYVKFRKPEETAILRIRRRDVFGLMDDEADFRAVRTMSSVSAFAGFEIMTSGTRDDFLQVDFRGNAEHWTPLRHWG